MAAPSPSPKPSFTVPTTSMEQKEDESKYTDGENLELISNLPKRDGWMTKHLHNYQGFWFSTHGLQGLLDLQQNFKAQPTNQVLLTSYPKSGTTWLKAILFSILNRKAYNDSSKDYPLLTNNPHECVPVLEYYAHINQTSPNPDLPLIHTHVPFTSLPQSIIDSGCRIIYVLRESKDVFTSLWNYTIKLRPKELPPFSMEEAFEMFCDGVSPYGPYWDHVLGFLNASLESPERIMVVKYEEMRKKPLENVKKLAEFLGQPFSNEEERQGMVEKLVSFCSFENLSNLEVNKTGTYTTGTPYVIHNSFFFRQAKVGDSKNLLTKEMMERVDLITSRKFKSLA